MSAMHGTLWTCNTRLYIHNPVMRGTYIVYICFKMLDTQLTILSEQFANVLLEIYVRDDVMPTGH